MTKRSKCATIFYVLLVITETEATESTFQSRDLNVRDKRTFYGPYCPPGCISCSSLNGCISCQSNYYLHLQRDGIRQRGLCVTVCPLGYFESGDIDFKYCSKCRIEHCDLCNEYQQCSLCKQPYVLHEDGSACVLSKCRTQSGHQNKSECNSSNKSETECHVGEWSSWSQCLRYGQTCGYKYGSMTRVREQLYRSDNTIKDFGLQCPPTMETKKCLLKNRNCDKDKLQRKRRRNRSLAKRSKSKRNKGKRKRKRKIKNE